MPEDESGSQRRQVLKYNAVQAVVTGGNALYI